VSANGDIAALEIAGLSAGYGRYDVVRDPGLRVGRGEAVALLGPNGAGKTTVLRSIMGLVKHRRGAIRIAGADVSCLAARKIARGHASLVPEGRRLFFDRAIEDNLLLGAFHLRRQPERVRELLDSVYDLFPMLHGVRRRPAAALNGGQQQMVALGRMLMSDPAVLLLDEPSLGVAPIAINEVIAALESKDGPSSSSSSGSTSPSACATACTCWPAARLSWRSGRPPSPRTAAG
jgi:branched-chain amino acid transport system ATP-binding protein